MSVPAAVILAAGQGKRMRSDLPKVVHEVGGRPMVEYVLDVARAAGVKRLIVVIGHRGEVVKQVLAGHPDVAFAVQEQQLGTGHAVMSAKSQLAEHTGPVLVLAGDTPLLRPESLKSLLDELQANAAACVIGTAITQNNAGLGRVVRNADGGFQKIVEERDASPAEKAIQEINTGCYAFDAPRLLDALSQIRPENAQAEYYLTDAPGILKAAGHPVLASASFTIEEALGVNTPEQLAQVAVVLKSRHSAPSPA